MKRCKDCGETCTEKLHQKKVWPHTVYNICKKCFSRKFSKPQTAETKLKLSKSHKGKTISEETKKKLRISAIRYIQENHFKGKPMYPRIGTNETEALDMIEYKLGVKLERQFKVAGYFLDGYDKINNVAYEVYENYHFEKKQRERDLLREDNIIKELNCALVKIIDRSIT